MARSGRPASESYQSVCYSGSQSASLSGGAGLVGPEEEDDRAPIFSLSKSSMDVVTTTLHKPSRADMRRSSSTNTHSEPTSVTLQQLHPHMLQHISSTSSPPSALTTQNVDLHSTPVLSERWIANMQRWSGHSGSTHSRSSTPDTVVWKDGSSRPLSQTQETLCSAVPDSPMSKQTSPPATPSPLISPLQTPTLPPEDLLTSFCSLQSAHQEKDFALSSPSSSLLPSPLQANTASPLPPSSSDLLQLTSTEDEGFLENNSLSFTFPSPIPSSVSLAEAAGSSDPGDVIEKLQSPRGAAILEGGGERSPLQAFGSSKTNSPAAGQEPSREISACRLQLPGQSGPTGRGWRSPLVSSLSDSQLRECCRCNLSAREGVTKAAKVEMFREDGTMTSRVELVDAAVQTISPAGSLWGLRRETSTSNMDAHSILGSPPGSRLNLKASVGSNSNLVSPSSSMFPVSSGEEEEKQRGEDLTWAVNSSSHDAEGRRSCLKTHVEEKDEMGRRSSMKQVQWDEDGMTWDVHGASVDPEVLSSAIRKHLENQNSPRQLRRSSKKKKAPMPPLISNIMRATTPEPSPPESTSAVEGDGVETPEEGAGREAEKEAGGKKEEETVEAARRISRAEGENAKEEEEVYGEEGTSHPKSPSRGSGRKKSVIRSLRPGWCGSSRKACD